MALGAPFYLKKKEKQATKPQKKKITPTKNELPRRKQRGINKPRAY